VKPIIKAICVMLCKKGRKNNSEFLFKKFREMGALENYN